MFGAISDKFRQVKINLEEYLHRSPASFVFPQDHTFRFQV